MADDNKAKKKSNDWEKKTKIEEIFTDVVEDLSMLAINNSKRGNGRRYGWVVFDNCLKQEDEIE